ncbi:MAG: hypothetical protein SAJ12_12350 [Jaaginema sp. PMC 1079.18]|nr:hypothetical protein [Jaaginema sp. PMC 1080.18]MEC4851797.1 hypothetical protein [Jaaginema sp. PMC 1079.18]MEC4867414.1 hypothetical protein [Jaaginema sp. PMC 1078.18]
MSASTILLITLLNATICLVLPRLLSTNWLSFFPNLLDSKTAPFGETPSQS